MGCLRYQERISDYADNLLPAAERQQMTDHLSVCASCRVVYEDIAMICQASRNLPQYEPRSIVWERILAAITAQPATVAASATSGQQAWLSRFKTLRLTSLTQHPAFSAAALILVAVAVVGIYFRSSAPPPRRGENPGTAGPSETPSLSIDRRNFLIVHKPPEIERVKQSIEKLQKEITKRETRWTPPIRTLFRQKLAYVNECINHCLKEAEKSQDPALRHVYHAALQAKLDMLRQFAEL